MNCIIVDDEPLARDGIQLLINDIPSLKMKGYFNNASSAADFISLNPIDLIFLDIQMQGMNGIDFARSIPDTTLVIFITAFASYALDSYEVDAIDYLVKPIHYDRFQKAVSKAANYHSLLGDGSKKSSIESVDTDFIFVKADRKYFKVFFRDILFIEGLKDYVVLHTQDKKIITAMNIKTIHEKLPASLFVRVSKSFVVNAPQISSFDNNTIFINNQEIPIGNNYRSFFFDEVAKKRLLSR